MSLPSGEILVEEGADTVVVISDAEVINVEVPQGEILLLEETWQAGSDGLSAYQVAVQEGFVGTEEQWLATLRAGSVLPFAFHAPGELTPGVLSGEYLAPWACLLESVRAVTGSGRVDVRVRVDGMSIGPVLTVTSTSAMASLANVPVAAGARVGVQLIAPVGGFNLSVTITAVTD